MHRQHKQDTEAELPADWEAAWSKEHNRPYYANRRTGQSSWVWPQPEAKQRGANGSSSGRAQSAPGPQNRRLQHARSQDAERIEAKDAARDEVKRAIEDPSSPDSALWRMTTWAERFCGKPRTAVRNIWRGRKAIERVFNIRKASPRDSTGLTTRALGRKLTQSWLAARTRHSQGMALSMANMEGSEAQEITGLLMYLEMAVSLVPDVSAHRLICIWELPEPVWASEHRKSSPLKFDLANPLRLLEPGSAPHSQPDVKKETKQDVAEKVADNPIKEEPKLPTWDIKRSFKFCKLGEERLFKGRLALLPEEVTSVRAGVDRMNQRSATDECCMVYNPGTKFYHVLYQEGERQTALSILGIPEPCGYLTAVVVAAHNLLSPGAGAGKGGAESMPSPYVVCRVGDEEYRTETVKDSLNPKWNSEDFQYHVNLREDDQKVLSLEVFDGKYALDEKSLGKTFVDLVSLEPKQTLKKIFRLDGLGLGQVELQLEFIPKREYQSRLAPGSAEANELKRKRRNQRPSWCIFEQELVYDQEISAFLKTLRPLPPKPQAPPKESVALPSGWEAAWDVDRNTFHFFNKSLGKSVLTRKAVDQVEAEVGGLPSGWGAAWDSRYNAYYFYNHQLQKTVWTREDIAVAQAESVVKEHMDTAIPKNGSIGNGSREKEKEMTDNKTEPKDGESSAEHKQDIKENTMLRCISKEDALIFESPESSLAINSVAPGEFVTAAGTPLNVGGFWMVPIQPEGAVELNLVEVVGEIPRGEIVPVSVTIVHGSNLKRMAPKASPGASPSVSCTVQVLGKPATVCQTTKINDVDPAWNEQFHIEDFSVGDPLYFAVWDDEEVIATSKMPTEKLLVENFDGLVKLSLKNASLRVSVFINDGVSRPPGREVEEAARDEANMAQAGTGDWASNKKSKRRRFLTRVGVLAKMGNAQSADASELDESDDLDANVITSIPTIRVTEPNGDVKKVSDPPREKQDNSPPRPHELQQVSITPKPAPRLRASPRVKVDEPDSD